MDFISTASNTWVIDLGAIDHMTSHSSPFDSLMPSLVKSVQVANGTPMSNLEAKNVSLPPHSPCPSSYFHLVSLRVLFLLARLPNILIVL